MSCQHFLEPTQLNKAATANFSGKMVFYIDIEKTTTSSTEEMPTSSPVSASKSVAALGQRLDTPESGKRKRSLVCLL
jgi:hypothetical protein